jgi:rRNA maturation RNase YbeY
VADNAKKFNATTEKELVRVMAHGLLHLIGFNDKKPAEKKKMRAAEEQSIKLYAVLKKEKAVNR